MSKKSKREAMLKEQAAKLRTETRKPPINQKSRSAGAKSGGSTARNGAAHTAGSHTYSGSAQKVTRVAKVDPSRLMTVRIIAVVLAVVALAGGIYWGYTARGNYTPGVIIGMILLGFLAGFSILIAVRTQDIVARAIQYQRR